jgi:hypothetical protein
MSMSERDEQLIDALLSARPQWQPPPGFAVRVAALAVKQIPGARHGWVPLLLRALALAACVSIVAWVGGELLFAALQSVPAQDSAGALSWLLAAGSLLLAWQAVRRHRQLA